MPPARDARQFRAGDDAGGGSRQQRLVGMTRTERDAHQSAVRLHEKELRRLQAALDQASLQSHQIVGDGRTDIGIDHGRRQPRIFADDRQHVRRQGDPALRCDLGHDLRRAPLVRGIEEREQEAHGEGFDALRLQAAHGVPQPRFIERGDDLAAIIEPLAHLFGQPLRRQQRRLLIERVEQIAAARLRPAARLVHRAKAPRDQQARSYALAFQQRVGCNRRSVNEQRDIGGVDAFREQPVHRVEDGGRRIAGNRWHLGATQLTGVLFDGDKIGERSSGIDAHQPHTHSRPPVTHFLRLFPSRPLAQAQRDAPPSC